MDTEIPERRSDDLPEMQIPVLENHAARQRTPFSEQPRAAIQETLTRRSRANAFIQVAKLPAFDRMLFAIL